MSASPLLDVREALATLLRTAPASLTGYAGVPPQFAAGTFYIRPFRGRRYIEADAGTVTRFGSPEVSMQIVLVAPGGSVGAAQDWLDETAVTVIHQIATNPTLGGLTGRLFVSNVSEPGTIDGQLIGVEISLAPFTVAALRYT